MDRSRPRRILAVASSGGHWIQLRRLEPAFAGHDVAWLTTHPGHRDEVAPARFHTVADANRRSKAALLRSALKIAWVLLRERPDVVVSTGAAPGYLAIRGARLLGARTAWIHSVANVDELSLSGRLASARADAVPHAVAAPGLRPRAPPRGGPVIFATVGTQLPFDRLVGAVDRWAATRGDRDVFAQVGARTLRPAAIA